jgi:glycosyl hydrolase family 39 (putative alpha-L-iduronidase)
MRFDSYLHQSSHFLRITRSSQAILPLIAFLCLTAGRALGATTATTGTIGIYPHSASIYIGTQQVFQAQLSSIPDANQVTFSVDGIVDGNSTVGTITNQGVYTAPKIAGTHRITVKDNYLGTTATSNITVYSNVSVNFVSRSTSGTHSIPPHVFGAERMDSLHDAADIDTIVAGGITYARIYAQIPLVFKAQSNLQSPNWPAIDSIIKRIESANSSIKIMLQMYQTPSWLAQSSSACGAYSPNSMPTNVGTWAQIAKMYVQHMDTNFHGVVTDYEIWNEPDTNALCVPASSKLPDYLALYKAAAPGMRQQVAADHASSRVGGPATAGLPASWVSAMFADSTIAQNIDFLSYHIYIFSNTQTGAQWNSYTNVDGVLQMTQDSYLGPEQYLVTAAHLLANAGHPNLPIYNTEYNLNWAYAKNCCQNDPTYSPVWNGLQVAGMLNAVYAGSPSTIQHMVYFAANAHPYFCLLGEIDANMDCYYPSGVTPQRYPQYFLYQLFGASNYLDLEGGGGHMAYSISPPEQGNGLVATAFFTPPTSANPLGVDSIVLVNSTAETLSNVPINIANTGFTGASATLYRIVSGDSIQGSSLALKSTGGTSYSTTVSLAPNSVQAIAIK